MTREKAIISITIGFSIFIILAILVSLGWGLPVVYYIQGVQGYSSKNRKEKGIEDQERGPMGGPVFLFSCRKRSGISVVIEF